MWVLGACPCPGQPHLPGVSTVAPTSSCPPESQWHSKHTCFSSALGGEAPTCFSETSAWVGSWWLPLASFTSLLMLLWLSQARWGGNGTQPVR